MTLNPKIKVIVVNLILIAAAIYLIEFYLAYSQSMLVKEHKETFGITEDRVTAAERLGVKVSVNGRWYRELGEKPPLDFPVGTFPNKSVIGFKEGDDDGGWPVHQTDQFGFFNDTNWWTDSPTMLIMGDSFVTCEHLKTNSLTREIRKRGVKAVNLGITGSGPVLQLAALRAYWKYCSNSVTNIVWTIYDGNDYQDAVEEWEVNDYITRPMMADWRPEPLFLYFLSTTNDNSLYGFKYAVKSLASLKRTRLIWRSKTGLDEGVRIWNWCIQQATAYCPNITVVRIPKPSRPLDRQWEKIEAPMKVYYKLAEGMYSKGMPLAHLSSEGYPYLAYVITKKPPPVPLP